MENSETSLKELIDEKLKKIVILEDVYTFIFTNKSAIVIEGEKLFATIFYKGKRIGDDSDLKNRKRERDVVNVTIE